MRDDFKERVKEWKSSRLLFIDEAGSHIGMTRDYARAPRGQRAHDHVPRNRGTVTTMLGALSLDGVVAMMTIEGATDTAVFETFVTHFLVPRLQPGDIVVWDNVGAHKPPRIQKLVEAAGATVAFLPPYSPDLNPIEECWSKLKSILKSLAARSLGSLDGAISQAMKLISPADAAGWFRHAGYSAHVA